MGLAEVAFVLIVMRPANIQGLPLREEHVFRGSEDRAWITCQTIKTLMFKPTGTLAYCIQQAPSWGSPLAMVPKHLTGEPQVFNAADESATDTPKE